MHIIRLSGHIPANKSWEFEQNVRQTFSRLPSDCTEFSVSEDLNVKGLYHIQLGWEMARSRDAFLLSENHKSLLASFKVLGILRNEYVGEFDMIRDE